MHLSYFISFLLLLFFPLSVLGHNWLGSIGRARPLASTRYPFPLRLSDQPHMQVGPNQEFPVEWAVGHGNNLPLFGFRVWTYIVILHADDQDKIPLTNREMSRIVNEYLRDAPRYSSDPSFVNLTAIDYWRAYQMHAPLYLRNGQLNRQSFWDSFNSTINKYYAKQILPNDPLFIQREPAYLAHCKNKVRFCDPLNPDSQWLYHTQWQRDDVRYEYIHPKYPWIESIHRFETAPTETSYVNQYNVARFRIPARKGPGNYIVWYRWHGYQDAVDVSVQPQAVANQFGVPANRTLFSRIDHCQYTNIRDPVTQCRRVDRISMNISQCLADCARNPSCTQVQVTRASNLPGSLNMFPNIPTIDWTDTRENVPICNSIVVQKRWQAGCRRPQRLCNITALNVQPDEYVCWGSDFVAHHLFEATPGWIIAEEPEDPVFFSTCYERFRNSEYLPYPTVPRQKPSWVAGASCVDCQFLNQTINDPIHIAPNWERGLINEFEGRCQSCSRLGI